MMRTSYLALAALVSAAPLAHAGTYIEQNSNMSMMGQNQSVVTKTWVEGDMVRKDDPRTGMVMLLNTRKAQVTGVTPAQKTWWQLPDRALAEFGAMTLLAYGIKRGPDGKLTVPPAIFSKTGQTKKTKVRVPAGDGKDKELDIEVAEVKVNMDLGAAAQQMQGLKSSIWIGQVPGYDASIERNRMTMFLGNGAETEAFLKQWDALGGVPVITETTLPSPQGTVLVTETVVKVAPQKVRPEDMGVPKSFKQVEDPLTKMKRDMAQQGNMPGMQNMPQPGQ